MVRIDAPEGFAPAAVRGWFAQLGEHAESDELVFNLPVELSPGVAVLLSATIAARARRERSTRFEQPSPARLGEPGRAVPVTQFSDAAGVRRFAADAARRIAPWRDGIGAGFEGELARALEDLGDNVLRHADSGGGWACAAVLPGDRRFQVAVADIGIGLRASLRRNRALRGRIGDDASAISFALREDVQRGRPGELGTGLARLRGFVEELGGELWIASGSALSRRGPQLGGEPAQGVRAISNWNGTWVCLDAPLDPRPAPPA